MNIISNALNKFNNLFKDEGNSINKIVDSTVLKTISFIPIIGLIPLITAENYLNNKYRSLFDQRTIRCSDLSAWFKTNYHYNLAGIVQNSSVTAIAVYLVASVAFCLTKSLIPVTVGIALLIAFTVIATIGCFTILGSSLSAYNFRIALNATNQIDPNAVVPIPDPNDVVPISDPNALVPIYDNVIRRLSMA